jgi:serine/threonine protein kinase
MKTTNKKTKRCKKELTTGGKELTTGGKALTSGGFGCLFKPALRCKNTLNYDKTNKKMVTKLMTTKHARDEYKQITEFKEILDHIPNYQDYFLVDGFSICELDELTEEDLEDFDENCDALKKKKITAANINQNLDKILALNMPDGGVDVDDYVFDITDPKKIRTTYTELNNSLVDLLVNGIEPMNRAKLYHCDVKGSNILVQDSMSESLMPESLMTRLIDWGLSVYRKDSSVSAGIPDKLDRRPFQFNVPFSVILFNKKFQEKYGRFLKNNLEVDYYEIREFVINYIFYWNKERGAGHLKTINSIVNHLSYNELTAIENKKVKNHVIEYEFTYYYIVEYISKILFKYTTNGKLNLLEYFNEVFLKNIDVWGLTMIYMVFLDHVQEVFDLTNVSHDQFIQKIKYIIIHFLFETPTEAININKLAAELQSLNKIIANFDKPNGPSEKVNYFASLKKIDTTDITSIKEIGGKINNKTKTKTKTIKKRRACGKPLTKRQRV